MSGNKRPFFGKSDLIMILIAVIVAAAAFAVFASSGGSDGVMIEYDGNEYAFVKFSEIPDNGEKDIFVPSPGGGLTVTVGKGYAYIKVSSCKGGDCVRYGRIDRPGTSIVCLPNRIAVYIAGSSGYDGRTG
ncbi:MAG: NusG domain II-containing protein [Clostridia bacterium]|nr:NusG domain II-containing protein [Clostridia bacterium]